MTGMPAPSDAAAHHGAPAMPGDGGLRQGGFVKPLKVFVVGGPRSGTSALTRALRLAFDLPGHGESHTIPAIAMITHPLRLYWERFQGNPSDLLIKILPTVQIEEMIFRFVRDFYVQTYGGGSWIDKTPSDEAVHSISLIPRIFPEARIIVIRRNGIEVVRSVRSKFGLPFSGACTNWNSVMAGVSLARKRCPQALEVDHRAFIHDLDAMTLACAEHLGRPELASHMADLLRHDRQDQSAADPGPSPTTLDDVDWTADEKAVFQATCEPWMTAFGYRMFAAGSSPEVATGARIGTRRSPASRRQAQGRQA